MDKETFIGNLTTILKILIMTIAPTIAVYIGIDQTTVLTFLTAVVSFIIAIADAKYPNTILDKTTKTEPTITITKIEETTEETTDEEDVEDDQQ